MSHTDDVDDSDSPESTDPPRRGSKRAAAADNCGAGAPTHPKRRPRRRWLVRAALVAAALLALVWFAPSLVALTPLRQYVAPLAVPTLNARLQIGSASLGWFSPVRLKSVSLADREGRALAEAPSVVIDKPLYALLLEYHRVGTIRLAEPRVYLAVREGGSNLEDLINPFLEGESSGIKYACRVEVAGGTLVFEDAAGNGGKLDEINGEFDYDVARDPLITAKLSCRSPAIEGAAGVLNADLAWHLGAEPAAGYLGRGRLQATADRVPLANLSPLVARVSSRSSLAGAISGNAHWEWNGEETHSFEFDAIEGKGLRVRAPDFLGPEVLRFAALRARGKASLEQGRAQAEGLSVECDFGELQASGAARISDLAGANPLAAALLEDYRLSGRLDLARLAAALPATLKIREGTRITSGDVSFELTCQPSPRGRALSGRVQTTELAAENEGKRIVWQEPLSVKLAVRKAPEGLVIDELRGNASFVQFSGQGSPAAGTLTASGDLDRLAAELGQFVDLESFELAGKLRAALGWKQPADNEFSLTGDVLVENFSCRLPGARPWREPRLAASLAASGALAPLEPEPNRRAAPGAAGSFAANARLETASLEIRAGADELDAELTAPVAAPSLASTWPFRARVAGSLATWLPRIQAIAPLSGWSVEGTLDLTAEGTASTERVELQAANLTLARLQAWGNGLYIYEPEMVIETAGVWEVVRGELTSRVTTLAGSAVALRADNVVLRLAESGYSLAGEMDYRADLNRLYSWTHDPRQPAPRNLFGGATGRIKLRREAVQTRAEVSAAFADLVFAQRKPAPSLPLPARPGAAEANPWEAVWSEKEATFAATGEYDHEKDALGLSKLELASQVLRLSASGNVAQPTATPRVDFAGEVAYDLPGIAALLRPYVGEDFQATGRDARKFFLRGPLPEFATASSSPQVAEPATRSGAVPATPASARSPGKTAFPPDLVGGAGLAWNSAQVQGLAIGKGELSANLARGVVAFDPLDLPLAEGRLRLAPSISLNTDPILLNVERGRILEQVRISPEMCRTWLKYVAPLLADATRAEGRFTLDLESCSAPLFAPDEGDVRGTLAVHEAQVGPGPLGQQAIWISQQVKALVEKRPLGAFAPTTGSAAGADLLRMPAQNVNFALVEKRVHHENLTFLVRDVTIRTRGSVGLDQSLALVAEVPVLDRWVEGDRVLAGLKGKTLHLPITGTLSQPKLDNRALEEVSKQMLSGAAKGVIENELNKSLQKLFGPKK